MNAIEVLKAEKERSRKETLSVYMPTSIIDELDRLAEKEGLTRSAVVIAACTDLLKAVNPQ